MGEHNIHIGNDSSKRVRFINHLINDIKALELMYNENMFEKDRTRIGAEQEFCIVENNFQPSKKSLEILESLNDVHFTTELARFNIEANLDPLDLEAACFNELESDLQEFLNKANEHSQKFNNKVLLAGILPSISKNELKFDYMTPNPRYKELNDKLIEVRGSDFSINFKGVDDLSIVHDSVLFEACNTSFQMHLQIDPYKFSEIYNWIQMISGPIMGISANSPFLLGRELWNETRIGLFQQSIETRASSNALVDRLARVGFGNKWAEGSIIDYYKDQIAEFKVIIEDDLKTNSLEEIKEGRIPKLKALNLHNGTIYKWNRPCYGISNGKPHIRIENRYIPAGPSIIDQVANFALWVGLINGQSESFKDIPALFDFRDAKSNFIKAARTGKDTIMKWFDKELSVRDLMKQDLIPMAYKGLEKSNIDKSNINYYLEIIEKRIDGRTGAQWQIRNFRELNKKLRKSDTLKAITEAIYNNQQMKLPVH